MPIRLNLDRVMLERRISLTELAERIGLTLANLSILKTNKELGCQPGDLLEYVAAPPSPPESRTDEAA